MMNDGQSSGKALILIFVPILFTNLVLTKWQRASSAIQMCNETTVSNAYIYCYGPILEAVNFHRLFMDSKDFVDMPLRHSPVITYKRFRETFPEAIERTEKSAVQQFVSDHFLAAGTELQSCSPSDWQPKPATLMTIKNASLRRWALHLNRIWKDLCKRMNETIRDNAEMHSILYVPYPFIAPGGRFREFYYWDSFWIVEGLLASQMYTSAKNMIRNLVHMIQQYGFVPNGGRVYYLQRSQMPMLTATVYAYYEHTKDKQFLLEVLPNLEKELQFWHRHRSVELILDRAGSPFRVYRFAAPTNVPRPEAFYQDVEHSKSVSNSRTFWQDIASAAESGMDFGGRWFSDYRTLLTIETTNVIPVDLNAIICYNFHIMGFFHAEIGNTKKSDEYSLKFSQFKRTLEAVFYNETLGTWYDYNLRTRSHNSQFYASLAIPLFAGCYDNFDRIKSKRLFQRFKEYGAFDFPSGVPSSLLYTSEQWDFPNGWSPLNHLLIEGLRKSGNDQMRYQASLLARKWVRANYQVYRATGVMWEKYNVIGHYPEPGKGGEYDVQEGFGWTNGVILDLLKTYPEMSLQEDANSSPLLHCCNTAAPYILNLIVVVFHSLIYH